MNISSKIIVLGGGTAGWITALFVKRYWPHAEITVIEDPRKPPIIAGESSNTTFISILRQIKIDVNDFVSKVNATPKLGGKFTDWNGVGTEFIHALQTDYAPWLEGWTDFVRNCDREKLTFGALMSIMSAERSKDMFLKTIIANDIPLAKAFFANTFIEENKVPFGAEVDIPCVPMWHFESRAAAAYFKNIGLERGILLVEGGFQHAVQDTDGDITSIVLEDGRSLDGDWFFDCSGFARLLLEKVLNEPIIDHTNIFPSRSVVAWWDDPCPCVTTNAIAMKYGWSWNINLRHRSGNGYIYDPDHITLDQAVAESEIRFGKKIDPIANFTFVPGIMRNVWKNNVVAIGLSGGFLEPLEANGVAVIVESLSCLQDYWSPTQKKYDKTTVDRFNYRIWKINEDIRDFIALHYRGKRRDTEFWISHGEDASRIPDSLKEKLESWRIFYSNRGPEPYYAGYSYIAWLMVLQGIKAFDHSNLMIGEEKLLPLGQKVLNINENKYKKLVAPFWTIEEWLERTA